MDRFTFEERLRLASRHAVQFAREIAIQVLPDNVMYLVFPNQSYDGIPLKDDEIIFPEESLPSGQYLGPWTQEEVVEDLWRSGKVPEWIDVAVQAENSLQSLVALRCCGRFTANEENLYHQHGGLAPFSIKSPYFPAGWESVEASGKFDLALLLH